MPAPKARTAPSSVAERYNALLDIGRTLASTLSADDLYAAIHRETARVVPASGFYIALYEPAGDTATIVYYADGDEVERTHVTFRGSDSEVLRTGELVLVEDRLDDRSLLHLGDDHSPVTRSAISAPMVHKGRVLGSVSAQSYEPNTYSTDDLTMLQCIADIAAVAVDNAQHVAELEKRRHEAERVEEIGRAITSSLDPSDVLRKVIDAVLGLLTVDGASVWLCDSPTGQVARIAESGGDIALPIGLTWDLSGKLEQELLHNRAPVVLDDLSDTPLVPPNLRSHLEAGSGMGAPVVVGNRVVGVLTAGSRRSRHFGKEDVAVLQRLANQTSVALENARLHANLQALSLTDPLTGLPNRRRLQIHMDQEVAAARRGRALVVVVFDLDDFKHYNDTLGHVAGDALLRAFAQVLAEENRAMNLVARYGGDEFVAVLSDTSMDMALPYIRRVRERVATDPIMRDRQVKVSLGAAEFDTATMKTAEDVIHAADADLYQVKAQRLSERSAPSS